MVRPMVHSTKHYVQHSISTILASARNTFTTVQTVAVGAKDLVNEVEEGSSVKACYYEIWLRSGETAGASFVATIEKIPGTGGLPSTATMAALGDYANKKNVLYTSQGLLNDQNADALSMIRGWIKIPKTKQRFGLGDRLVLSIFAQGAIDVHMCGFSTYKEYS